MPSTSNFDLTYNQQNVVAGGALSNPAATTGTSTGSGVTKILSGGSNVTLSPTSGVGDVTISVTSGGSGTVTEVKGQGSVNGITLTGDVTTSGYLTLGGSLSAVDLTSQVSGVLPKTNGGTGNTTGNAATVTGLSVASGKTLTASNTLTLAGTDGSTLNVGAGGTLGSAAYTSSSAYDPSGAAATVLASSLQKASNLNDLTSASTARSNLGLGTAATQNSTAFVASSSGSASNLTLTGTLTASSSAGSSGQVLQSTGSGVQWITPSTGGNVTGSGTSTSGHFAAFNNTSATGIADTGYSPSSFDVSGAAAAAQAYSIQRSNQTGTQAASTITGLAASATTDTTNANNITSGTLPNARLSSVPNSALANSSVTINTSGALSGGGTVSLGGSLTLTGSGGLPSGSQGQALLYGTSGAAFLSTAINVNTYSTISGAASAAQSAGTTLYFPQGSYTISSSLTISCPVAIDGLITINSGQTLTLTGSVTAPLKKVFTVNGSLSIGGNTPYIYPEWFGTAKTGASDDQPAVAAALSAVSLANGTSAPNQFVVLTGTYYLGSSLTLTNSQMFKVVGGATFYPYGSYTGDCIIYQYNTNNTLTDIPTIQGFTTGAGITILGCSVMKATGFMIKNCKYGIKIKATSTHPVLDNYVNVHFLPDCQYGVFFTDDGTSATIQGNEVYSNFYTNDNISTNPWVSGGYAANIAACYWDNLNVYNWNGNTVQIKAIDINGATSSYGFYNASSFSTYGGNSFLNGWQIACPLWFGGINSHNLTSAYYHVGGFLDSEFRFAIQTPSANAPYNLINTIGNGNRFIFAAGGGAYSLYNPTGAPQSFYAAQGSANSRSSFANSSSNYCAPFANRIFCSYTISSTIPANGELTLYIYTPVTDAYLGAGVYFAASNNYSVLPLANFGLIFETAYDNSLTNANEVVVKFRNVSGADITSGTFNFMVTVGL